MCKFSAYIAFNKATNGQTDIKHKMGKHLAECHCWLKITDEKLPPLQKSSLETGIFNSDIQLSVFPISCFI